MSLVEMRIVLPFTLDEFRVGHIFARRKLRELENPNSKTSIARNCAYKCPRSSLQGKGIYTHYRHSFSGYLPHWAEKITGTNALSVNGYMWDEFPYITSSYQLPSVARAKVHMHTVHIDNDAGDTENIFNLSRTQLRNRQVVRVDAGQEGETIRRSHGISSSAPPLTVGWLRDRRQRRHARAQHTHARTLANSAHSIASDTSPASASAPVSSQGTLRNALAYAHSAPGASDASLCTVATGAPGGTIAAGEAERSRGRDSTGDGNGGDKDGAGDAVATPGDGTGDEFGYMCAYVLVDAQFDLPLLRHKAQALFLQHLLRVYSELHAFAHAWREEWYALLRLPLLEGVQRAGDVDLSKEECVPRCPTFPGGMAAL